MITISAAKSTDQMILFQMICSSSKRFFMKLSECYDHHILAFEEVEIYLFFKTKWFIHSMYNHNVLHKQTEIKFQGKSWITDI